MVVVYMFFLRNRLYLGRTDVTSFCMHFEKIGRGLLREGKRREGEWSLWAKRGGMKSYFSNKRLMRHRAKHWKKNKRTV